MSKRLTQDMRYRQSLLKFADKYGVSRASRKVNNPRSTIYFWLSRWDGTLESLCFQSRRPHHHPNQHTEAELALIRNMRRRNPDLGISELWVRLKKLGYSKPTLFEATAASLGIRHKLIRPYSRAITARSSAATAKTGNASTRNAAFTHL